MKWGQVTEGGLTGLYTKDLTRSDFRSLANHVRSPQTGPRPLAYLAVLYNIIHSAVRPVLPWDMYDLQPGLFYQAQHNFTGSPLYLIVRKSISPKNYGKCAYMHTF